MVARYSALGVWRPWRELCRYVIRIMNEIDRKLLALS
jgi:hypothetical protein